MLWMFRYSGTMPPEKYMVNRISMAMGRESMEPFSARK